MLLLFIFGWLISGILAYGIIFAAFQGRFPAIAKEQYKRHRNLAIRFGASGYLGLLMVLVFPLFDRENPIKHGLKFY